MAAAVRQQSGQAAQAEFSIGHSEAAVAAAILFQPSGHFDLVDSGVNQSPITRADGP